MARRTIELSLTLTNSNFNVETCARCIEERLINRPGIREAKVTFTPAPGSHASAPGSVATPTARGSAAPENSASVSTGGHENSASGSGNSANLATVVSHNGQPHRQTHIVLDYDPDLLSAAEIDRYIRATGACLDHPIDQLVIPVQGMISPRHELSVQAALSEIPGVQASASYASRTVRVEFDPCQCNVSQVLEKLQQLGLKPDADWQPPCPRNQTPMLTVTAASTASQAPAPATLTSTGTQTIEAASTAGVPPTEINPLSAMPGGWVAVLREPDMALAVAAGVFLFCGFAIHFNDGPQSLRITLLVLSYICGGWYPMGDLLQTLRRPQLNIDVLMLAAAIGAAVLGHYEEGALLLFLFSLGGAGERLAMDRARSAIKSLSQLAPDTATLIDASGREMEVRVESLAIGDLVLVRPGQRIAADGQIVAGVSAVNQSPISGESIPVDKQVGDEVFAGTLNGSGVLKIRVNKPAGETTLARISRLVEEAQTTKSPTQVMTDNIEKWYVPVIIIGTFALMLIPPLLGVHPTRPGSIWAGWFYQAMAFLTAASPCALAIGTPAAVLSGIARAAWAGVLIKGGAQLENLGRVRVIAFDKTGTLTTGNPSVTDAEPTDASLTSNQLLSLAASVESGSSHPLAKAVVTHAKALNLPMSEATSITQTPGLGITGLIDGKTIAVGRPSMFASNMTGMTAAHAQAETLEAHGKTVMIVASNDRAMGVIALADQARASAIDAIVRVRKLGIRRTIMLTGDNRRTAEAIAKQVGTDEVFAELFPEDKLTKIRELDKQYGHVAMVGDGVNDAPALANASVGIAIAGGSRTGSDAALESADVALLSDDLTKLPQAIGISRFTRHIIVQNLVIALGVIAVLAPLAAFGQTSIGGAVFFHEGSTVLVVINALRILRHRP